VTAYYHGGAPGLRLGQDLLPPTATGHRAAVDYVRPGTPGAELVRRDRVYFTEDPMVADLFAALYPAALGGWVYEVDPVGLVEPDPDYRGPGGGSLQAPMAVVVRVLGPLRPAIRNAIRAEIASGLTSPPRRPRARRRGPSGSRGPRRGSCRRR